MSKLVKLWLTSGLLISSFSNAVAQETTVQTPSGHELCLTWKEKAKGAFPISCSRNMPEHVVQKILDDGSEHRFLVGVWGGRDEHRIEAIKVVNRMYASGKTVGIVFGPDRDVGLSAELAELDAEFEPYAHGRMALEKTETIGMSYLHQIGNTLYSRFDEAYNLNYPPKP